MSAHRWILSVVGLVVVVVLYNLPKVVVDNDPELEEESQASRESSDSHVFEISDTDRANIKTLRNQLKSSIDKKKSTIFADSLASLYLAYNLLDSADWYAEYILSQDSSIESQLLAGEIFFKAFSFSADPQSAKHYGDHAAECFSKVIAVQKNPDVEAKLAMTMVTSSNPMQGIMMLRRILDEYPNNITALFNMGLLSMQSGQYDKAVERFEKLMTIDESNFQAAYYLGVSYFETEDYEQARNWFTRIKNTGTDPAMTASAEQYLKRLNEL